MFGWHFSSTWVDNKIDKFETKREIFWLMRNSHKLRAMSKYLEQSGIASRERKESPITEPYTENPYA